VSLAIRKIKGTEYLIVTTRDGLRDDYWGGIGSRIMKFAE